jgi:hypothetical protein
VYEVASAKPDPWPVCAGAGQHPGMPRANHLWKKTRGVTPIPGDVLRDPGTTERFKRRSFPTTSRLITGTFCVALLAAGLLGAAVASANPPPSPPGPGEPGYCGAHTDAMDCWANTGPMTPGEAAFLNDVRGQVTGDDTTLLRNVRGICEMVTGGVVTSYIVSDIAQHYGITNASAVQVMHAATSFACH